MKSIELFFIGREFCLSCVTVVVINDGEETSPRIFFVSNVALLVCLTLNYKKLLLLKFITTRKNDVKGQVYGDVLFFCLFFTMQRSESVGAVLMLHLHIISVLFIECWR